jgi:hypothetical protein
MTEVSIPQEPMEGEIVSSTIDAPLPVALAAKTLGSDLDAMGSKEEMELAVSDMLSKSYEWLTRAHDSSVTPQAVKDVRSYVNTIAEATRQRDLSREIQMDAKEMARRADYALGKAIRDGQATGEIVKNGHQPNRGNQFKNGALSDSKSSIETHSPYEFVQMGGESTDIYAMADSGDSEQFQKILDEARAEENLSRANVARKARALSSPITQESASQQKQKKISQKLAKRSVSIIETSLIDFDTAASSFEFIEWDAITPEQAAQWLEQLNDSIKSINKFYRTMKKKAGK